MDGKTYISRQGVELVNPVVIEQRQLDKLHARIAELEALLGKGRPVPRHGSGP